MLLYYVTVVIVLQGNHLCWCRHQHQSSKINTTESVSVSQNFFNFNSSRQRNLPEESSRKRSSNSTSTWRGRSFDDDRITTLTTVTATTTETVTEQSTAWTTAANGDERIEAISFCNDPGRPFRSQISPIQRTYTEGETVQYTCDEFISLKQFRKCVRGKWEGDVPICGKLNLRDCKQADLCEGVFGGIKPRDQHTIWFSLCFEQAQASGSHTQTQSFY